MLFLHVGDSETAVLVIEWWWRLPEADRMQNTTPRSLEHLAGANGNGSLPWWLRCHPPGVSASAVTGLGFSNPSRTVQHLALKDGFSLCFSMFFRVRPWMKKLSPPRFARRLNRQQAQLDRLEATRSIRSFVAEVQKNLKVGCCWIRTPSDSWLLQYMFLEKYVATSLRRHCDAGDWVVPKMVEHFRWVNCCWFVDNGCTNYNSHQLLIRTSMNVIIGESYIIYICIMFGRKRLVRALID